MGILDEQQSFTFKNYTVNKLFEFQCTLELDRCFKGSVNLPYDDQDNPKVKLKDILRLVNTNHQLIDPSTDNLIPAARSEFYSWLNQQLFESLFFDLSSYLSDFFLKWNLQTSLSSRQLLISKTCTRELKKLNKQNKMSIMNMKANIYDIEDLSKCMIEPLDTGYELNCMMAENDQEFGNLIGKFLVGERLFPLWAYKKKKQLSKLNEELKNTYFLYFYLLKIDALKNLLEFENENSSEINDVKQYNEILKYPNHADKNFVDDLKRIIANQNYISIASDSFMAISVRNKAFFSNFFNYYAFQTNIQPFFLNQTPDEFILIVQKHYPDINLGKLQDKKTQKTRNAFKNIMYNYLDIK